jgi:hypothetical protein
MPSDVVKVNRIFGEKCSERNNMFDNAVVLLGSVVTRNTIDCKLRVRETVNLFVTSVIITQDGFQRAANCPDFRNLVGTVAKVILKLVSGDVSPRIHNHYPRASGPVLALAKF